LMLHLDGGLLNLRLPVDNTDFFNEARARLPVANTLWDVVGAYGTPPELGGIGKQSLEIMFKTKAGEPEQSLGSLTFFAEQPNVLDSQGETNESPYGSTFNLWIALQQNGEKPDQISGVLVSGRSLIGNSKSVYISAFSTKGDPNEIPTVSTVQSTAAGSAAATTGGASAANVNATPSSHPELIADESVGSVQSSIAPGATQPFLLAVLGSAFIGGLILNLMPCVLPVLSLKVFALVRHAGENPGAAWKQGVAFTTGVVISFWVLAGLLLVLRAAGNQLGWGFQMQSPGFVLALIFLFFLLALNLFGVFEVGASLVGLDAKATSHVSGLTSSFLNGALATLAATPCTAPYMGWALGVAAQQSAAAALLIFTFLAFGMAAPYLLLTIFPGALRFVPKPGAWMEAVRQFMGFLLLATVIFLIYVFGALIGQEHIPELLGALLVAGLAVWIYGRWWAWHTERGIIPLLALLISLGLLYYSMAWGIDLAFAAPSEVSTSVRTNGQATDGWQPWTPQAVSAALAQGQPVFVDFTAAWCLSCKVNERLALGTDAVKQAFTDKKVALFRADWTHYDPAISTTLQKYNRDGVPLYLLYSPKNPDAPQVLPEVLTSGIVLDVLKGL